MKTEYLSKQNTDCLKGILAVGVLAHHLYQYSGLLRTGILKYLGTCFQALGFVCVAMFFFLSGYGLVYAYQKQPTYLSGFFRKKILPFYLIILFYTLVYAGFDLWMGMPIRAEMVCKSLTFGGTLIKNGWYLQVQLLYYLLFLLVFLQKNNSHKLLTMLAVQSAYVLISIACGTSSLTYERSFIFFFGMMWAEKQEQMQSVFFWKKHQGLQIIITIGLFGILYGLSSLCHSAWMTIIFRTLSYFPFVLLVLLAVGQVSIQNAITRFFGKISLELYIVQAIPILLFRSERLYIQNVYLYIAACAICAVLMAMLLQPVSKRIYSLCRGLKK